MQRVWKSQEYGKQGDFISYLYQRIMSNSLFKLMLREYTIILADKSLTTCKLGRLNFSPESVLNYFSTYAVI